MKKTIVMLICCVMLWCNGCKEEDGTSLEENLQVLVVAKVERCPNDHDTIKAVPIQYGLIHRTAETDEKKENYEVAYGGCMVDSYGSYKFVCTTCGCSTYEKIGPGRSLPLWVDKTTQIMDKGKAIVVIKTIPKLAQKQ